jgi:hypothetical protein
MLKTIRILSILSVLCLAMGTVQAQDDSAGQRPTNPDISGKIGLHNAERSLNIYWDDYHDTDGDSLTGNYSILYSELTSAGHTVVEMSVPITTASLAGFDVLVIIDNEVAISGAEITDINNWVDATHSLFVIGEWSSAFDPVSTNALLTPYGIQFIGDSFPLVADTFNPHPITAGVSTLEIAGSGWLSGGVELGYADTGELVLSAFETDMKVLVHGDSNTFQDGYIGTYDEILCLHNIMDWFGAVMLPLTVDTNALPARGGIVNFSLMADLANADRGYILLGSVSGTSPGIMLPGGMATLPLNPDYFMNFVVSNLNTPLFDQFMGELDATGSGSAKLDTTGLLSVSPGCIGTILYFAYALYDPWDFASNAVEIEIVP